MEHVVWTGSPLEGPRGTFYAGFLLDDGEWHYALDDILQVRLGEDVRFCRVHCLWEDKASKPHLSVKILHTEGQLSSAEVQLALDSNDWQDITPTAIICKCAPYSQKSSGNQQKASAEDAEVIKVDIPGNRWFNKRAGTIETGSHRNHCTNVMRMQFNQLLAKSGKDLEQLIDLSKQKKSGQFQTKLQITPEKVAASLRPAPTADDKDLASSPPPRPAAQPEPNKAVELDSSSPDTRQDSSPVKPTERSLEDDILSELDLTTQPTDDTPPKARKRITKKTSSQMRSDMSPPLLQEEDSMDAILADTGKLFSSNDKVSFPTRLLKKRGAIDEDEDSMDVESQKSSIAKSVTESPRKNRGDDQRQKKTQKLLAQLASHTQPKLIIDYYSDSNEEERHSVDGEDFEILAQTPSSKSRTPKQQKEELIEIDSQDWLEHVERGGDPATVGLRKPKGLIPQKKSTSTVSTPRAKQSLDTQDLDEPATFSSPFSDFFTKGKPTAPKSSQTKAKASAAARVEIDFDADLDPKPEPEPSPFLALTRKGNRKQMKLSPVVLPSVKTLQRQLEILDRASQVKPIYADDEEEKPKKKSSPSKRKESSSVSPSKPKPRLTFIDDNGDIIKLKDTPTQKPVKLKGRKLVEDEDEPAPSSPSRPKAKRARQATLFELDRDFDAETSRPAKRKKMEEEAPQDVDMDADGEDYNDFIVADSAPIEYLEEEDPSGSSSSSEEETHHKKHHKHRRNRPKFEHDTPQEDEQDPSILGFKYELKQAFQIFLQYIVSGMLSPEEGTEIAQDRTGYWFGAIQRIRSYVYQCKDTVVASSVWNATIKERLDAYPVFISTNTIDGGSVCQACNRKNHTATFDITLKGIAYDSDAFWNGDWSAVFSGQDDNGDDIGKIHGETDEDFDCFNYQLGRECHKKAELYHKLQHYQLWLARRVQKRIKNAQIDDPDLKENSAILDKVLEDDRWIDELWLGFKTLEDKVFNFVEEARKLKD